MGSKWWRGLWCNEWGASGGVGCGVMNGGASGNVGCGVTNGGASFNPHYTIWVHYFGNPVC